jgi:hypothetical protein
MEERSQFRYVWLDMNTGKFSNSWDEDTHNKFIDNETKELPPQKDNWKLIRYQCQTDDNFEFYGRMKVVTNTEQ